MRSEDWAARRCRSGPAHEQNDQLTSGPLPQALTYSIAGQVIFAGLTVVDFQRLRMSSDAASAPLLAASIFLDGLNVFLFFLRIFDRRD